MDIVPRQRERITAVVLTHNRKQLLLRTLQGLFTQTRAVDCVVLIDSASTDGTYDELMSAGIFERSDVQYVRLEENKGASGGFAAGISRALEEGATWVWILDDDIVPREDCLASLLSYKDISHCLCPFREDKTVPFFNPLVGLTTHSAALSYANGKELVFTNTGSFEGMLLHRDIIIQVGLPDERFFLVSGDMVYGFLASLYTNVLHVKKAFIHRMLPERRRVSNERVYLFIRNQFLVKEYLGKYSLLQAGFFNITLTSLVFYYCTIVACRRRSLILPFVVIKGVIDGIGNKFGAP